MSQDQTIIEREKEVRDTYATATLSERRLLERLFPFYFNAVKRGDIVRFKDAKISTAYFIVVGQPSTKAVAAVELQNGRLATLPLKDIRLSNRQGDDIRRTIKPRNR